MAFAAGELSKCFKAMTGRDYPVSSKGKENDASLVRLKVDTRLNHDGYRIYRDGQTIRIAGGSPRGCLYGVYTLLGKFGCRWPLPGKEYEVVPKLKEISWSGPAIQSAPAITGRGMTFAVGQHPRGGLDEILILVDWLAKNRFNFLFLCAGKLPSEILPELKEAFAARDMGLEWGLHWLPKYLPRDLFTEHPGCFRMENGKRTSNENMCPSSPEAADIIARNSLEDWGQLREFPRFETLHLWPNDLNTGGWCSCEKCKALSDSDQAVKIINEVARRLPLGDIALAHLSYHATAYPLKSIKPDPNVRLFYAPRERCYKHALGECPVNREYLECLKGQIQDFPNEPEIFEYYHDMVLFRNLPLSLHPTIGKDIKVYREAGAVRISSLSFGEFSKWAYGPTYYVLGKCLWRGEGDPEDMGEYCEAMYGPHAQAMKQYYDLLFEFCGTAMQRCEYPMGLPDMRNPTRNHPYAKAHVALLAPVVTPEFLDKIEGVLKDALANAAEPYRSRIDNQLGLWRFARLEVPTIYRTMLASYLNSNLGKDATDTDRLLIIATINKVLQDIDKASEVLLAAPATLRGPLSLSSGSMKHRVNGFGKGPMRRWMRTLEKQQKGSKHENGLQKKQP